MGARVKNILGIQGEFEVATDNPVLIFGPNASGKTSAIEAWRACVAGDANPYGFSATAKMAYRNSDGEEDCFAEVDGAAKWVPGVGITDEPGGFDLLSPMEAGLESLMGVKEKKGRNEILERTFIPDTTRDLVVEAIGDILPGETQIQKDRVLDEICDRVDKSGWAAAATVFVERRRAAQRNWEDITNGVRFSLKRASDFFPENWRSDLDSLSLEDAAARITGARDLRDGASRSDAVSEAEKAAASAASAEMERIHEEIEKVQRGEQDRGREAELKRLEEAHSAASEKWTIANTNLLQADRRVTEAKKNTGKTTPDFVCPDCNAKVFRGLGGKMVNEAKFKKEMEAHLDELDKESNAKLAIELEANEVRSEAKKRLEEARAAANEVQTKLAGLRASEQEQARIIAKGRGEVQAPNHEQILSAAQEAVRLAERDADLVRIKLEADLAKDEWVAMNALAERLGVKGPRGERVEKGVGLMNAHLADVCAAGNWPVVFIEEDRSILIGGRQAALCSRSEKWRARAALQIAALGATGNASETYLLLDDVDCLDKKGWRGLVAIVERLKNKNPDLRIIGAAADTGFDTDGWPGKIVRMG